MMKKQSSNSKGSTHNRRNFLQHLAVLGISSTVLPCCANAIAVGEDNGITVETLEAAEKLADIQLNNEERKEILEKVKSNVETFKKFREQHLGYYSFPSMVFNPVPPGFKFDHEQKPLVFCLRIYLVLRLSFVSLLKNIFSCLMLCSVLLVVRATLGCLIWHAERTVVVI